MQSHAETGHARLAGNTSLAPRLRYRVTRSGRPGRL